MQPTTEILARISKNSLANKEEILYKTSIATCCVLTSTFWRITICTLTTERQRKVQTMIRLMVSVK